MNGASKRWSAIYANEEFLCFETCSGLRSYASDPAAPILFTLVEDEPELLGVALRASLSASRTLRLEELDEFFDRTALAKRYEKWVLLLLEKFDYDSRKSLFRVMRHCMVEESAGVITLRPTKHENLEAWSGDGIDKSQYVEVLAQSSARELGQAVALALSRCE